MTSVSYGTRDLVRGLHAIVSLHYAETMFLSVIQTLRALAGLAWWPLDLRQRIIT